MKKVYPTRNYQNIELNGKNNSKTGKEPQKDGVHEVPCKQNPKVWSSGTVSPLGKKATKPFLSHSIALKKFADVYS